MIRIKDIAERAGVSPTTVSNVLHGKAGRVSKENVKKIKRIMDEMHYIPSISAQLLAGEHSGLIGVAVGYPKKNDAFALEDPFVAALLGNLEYEIRERGYYMMLLVRHDMSEMIGQVLGWNFDGLITIGLMQQELRQIHAMFGKPMVAIDSYDELPEGVVNIGTDDRDGGYQMGRYLTRMGHRRLLFLSDNDGYLDHERWLGVREALSEAGVPDAKNRHVLIERDRERRERQYQEQFAYLTGQTALFYASDYYAVEASNFFQSRGILVPDQLSIAGFDDVSYAKMARPGLTTIRQNVDVKARYAVKAVMDLLEGREVQREYRVISSLAERRSVRRISETSEIMS